LARVFAAAVAGYEVVGRLGAALGPAEHYDHGFHPTGTCGVFGCAAVTASLLGLDAGGVTRAFGIAGSLAAGSMEFLAGGTWTKRLHPGWAAHSGILAALLAREGFTGPDTILEGRAGFLNSYSDGADAERLCDRLGEDFQIGRTSIKAHACCRYKQAPIDGLLEILRTQRLTEADVRRVTIGVLGAGWNIISEPLDQKLNPASVVDAQFSMPYGAAVALVRGRASIHEYNPETLADPAVRAAMRKVHSVRDPALDARFPRQWPAWTEVETLDGRTYRVAVDHPKGDPENPLSWDELAAKFDDLSGAILPAERKTAIAAFLRDASPNAPVAELTALLRA
jgi:2-methylcitrate dehydratase PrpD